MLTLITLIRPKHSSFFKIISRNTSLLKETTPNPNCLKFIPCQPILPFNKSFSIKRSQVKRYPQSPLAEKLFQIPGVHSIFLGSNYITVTKQNEKKWEEKFQDNIMKCIKKFLESNQKAVLSTGISNNSTQEEQNEIVEMILELLEFRIKPTIQEDGGDIHYKKYDHESGLVYIKLAGSCVGCPSSSITLKLGVENMFKHYIPEVKGVINVGDRDDDENDEEDLPEITLTEKIDVKPKPVPWKENQI